MSDLHTLPLMGHDLPDPEEMRREEWLEEVRLVTRNELACPDCGQVWTPNHVCKRRP